MTAQTFTLGPFDLFEPIGKGGMAIVWRGRHRSQGVEVAVKVLNSELAKRPKLRAALRTEGRAVAGLTHPHIVSVYDVGDIDEELSEQSGGQFPSGTTYIAMEYARQGSLNGRTMAMQWPQLLSLLLQLLDALGHAHARGIIHRDLKPANVLIGDESQGFKLTDFGMALLTNEHAPEATFFYGGTPSYMAPEQCLGQWRDVGPWSDLYALGCLTWRICTGKNLVATKDMKEAVRLHTGPLPAFEPIIDLPRGFIDWCHLLLTKPYQQRFQRAADAISNLHTVLESAKRKHFKKAIMSRRTSTDTPVPITTLNTFAKSTDSVPLLEPTMPSPMHVRPVDESSRSPVRVHYSAPPPAPIPPDWRKGAPLPSMNLAGAGLGLYGLKPVPMVGRELERDLLWTALRQVEQNQAPLACVLQGPAGYGKSRLARWLCETAHEQGAADIVRALHSPLGGPFAGLSSMIARHLNCIMMARPEMEARLERELGPRRRWGGDWSAVAEIIASSSEAGQDQISQRIIFSAPEERYILLLQLLSRPEVQRPVILWLDDVQWGPEALEFTRYALESETECPLLFVLTARDESLAEHPMEAQRLSTVLNLRRSRSIRLGPLKGRPRTELITGLLGLQGTLAAQVEHRTAGNPLFAVQLVGDWIDRGLLEPTASGFRLRPGAEITLPNNIQRVWTARLDELLSHHSPEEGLALELAAVLGDHVDREEWKQVCARAGADPSDALVERLVERRLAVLDLENPLLAWGFVHGMVREALVERARERGQWSTLHGHCAHILQSYPGLDGRERYVRHLLRTDHPIDALAPLLKTAHLRVVAGELRLSEALLEEYERALHDNAIPPEDTRWCDGWLVAARVEVMRDNVEEAEYWLSRVDQTATTYCWPNYEARVLMERGNMARRLGDLLHAKNLLNRASLLLAEHGTEEDRIDCADKQTYVALAMGDIEASHRLAKEAIDYYCQQPDEDVPMALAYVRLSYTQRIRGLLDEARANMQTACAIFEKLGARRPLADARSLFAEVAREQGNFDEARDLYDSAMSLYRAIGAQDGIAAIEAAYSILLVLLERYEEARIRLLAVMEGHTHRPGHLASLHGTLFPCAAHSADWEKAEHHLAETNTLTKISGFCDKDLATTVTIGGDIAARAGKMALAERAWTYAANVYERLGDLEMAASLHAKSAPESG